LNLREKGRKVENRKDRDAELNEDFEYSGAVQAL
jgi:hypothetical protein